MKLHFIKENEKINKQVASFVEIWQNESAFFETPTSGSTGIPKVISIAKKHAIASAKSTIDFLKILPSDNALLCLNLETIGGKMMLVRSFVNKMDLFVTPPVSNPLKNLTVSIDFIALAPIQLATILEESPQLLKSIRNIIVGGGVISEEIQQLLRKEKITVYQTFGMTETISHIALRKVGLEQENHYSTLTPTTVSAINDQLCIHAPHLGIESLVTNDLVEIVSNNQFNWIGRADFIINSGGVKIQLELLEQELKKKIKNSFFVYKKYDSKLGEKVVLVIEGIEDKQFQHKEFYSFIQNNYHIPKEVAFVDTIIRTKSDKINRKTNFELLNETSFKQIL